MHVTPKKYPNSKSVVYSEAVTTVPFRVLSSMTCSSAETCVLCSGGEEEGGSRGKTAGSGGSQEPGVGLSTVWQSSADHSCESVLLSCGLSCCLLVCPVVLWSVLLSCELR